MVERGPLSGYRGELYHNHCGESLVFIGDSDFEAKKVELR
jgi:hypothetical protein